METNKLIIEQYPNVHLTKNIFPSEKINIHIDIHRTVRHSYLTSGTELTHEKALSIFRDMKWKSHVKAALLNPISLFSISLIAIPSLLIPASGVLFIALSVCLVVGASAIGFAFNQISINRCWEKAYDQQAKRLSEYITKLETNPTMTVELAPLKPKRVKYIKPDPLFTPENWYRFKEQALVTLTAFYIGISALKCECAHIISPQARQAVTVAAFVFPWGWYALREHVFKIKNVTKII